MLQFLIFEDVREYLFSTRMHKHLQDFLLHFDGCNFAFTPTFSLLIYQSKWGRFVFILGMLVRRLMSTFHLFIWSLRLLWKESSHKLAWNFTVTEILEFGTTQPDWKVIRTKRERNSAVYKLAQLAKRNRHTTMWRFRVPKCWSTYSHN
jgi:hypothetical protein